MANFGEINFKLLVVSTNQSEIEEKLKLLDEKQNQLNRILIKQCVLNEEKVTQKVIQFLVKKITKISEELRILSRKARADFEELVRLIHDTANGNYLKRRRDALEQEPTLLNEKERKMVNDTKFQQQDVPSTTMKSPSQQTWFQQGNLLEWRTINPNPRDPRQRFKYATEPELNKIDRTIEVRKIPDEEKINCKIKEFK